VPAADAADITSLADSHDQPPALVAEAMWIARACGGGIDLFDQVLEASAKVTNVGVAPPPCHHFEAP